jgi:subtilisin family serine protease
MKVTITKYLNVRVGSPSVNAPSYQYLAPGSELEVDGELHKGDPYKGIDTWLKDAANNYYWSGGTDYQIALNGRLQNLNNSSSVLFNYNSQLKISTKYKSTKGENSLVAIIDTGCYMHTAIKDSIKYSYDVFSKSKIQNDESTNAHGTFLAGLIAASEIKGNKIVGVAPKAQLIIVKAIKNNQVFAQQVLDALNWIDGLSPAPDVINMSLDFNPGEQENKFLAVFESLWRKNVAILAAAQDGIQLYYNSIFYPAKVNNIVGVGSLSINDIQNGTINSHVDFVLPNLSFTSLNNFPDDYKTLDGSSMATAIVAGCFALMKSYDKTLNVASMVQLLQHESSHLTSSNFDNNLKLYTK